MPKRENSTITIAYIKESNTEELYTSFILFQGLMSFLIPCNPHGNDNKRYREQIVVYSVLNQKPNQIFCGFFAITSSSSVYICFLYVMLLLIYLEAVLISSYLCPRNLLCLALKFRPLDMASLPLHRK